MTGRSDAETIARSRYAREARGEDTPGFYPHNPVWDDLDDYHRSLYIKDAEDDLKALERRAANATDVGPLRSFSCVQFDEEDDG